MRFAASAALLGLPVLLLVPALPTASAAPNDDYECRVLVPLPPVYIGHNCQRCDFYSGDTCSSYDNYYRVLCLYDDLTDSWLICTI